MIDPKKVIHLTLVVNDNGEVYVKRLGCRGAEYYETESALVRLSKLFQTGFGLAIWLFFVSGEEEGDFYLPERKVQLEWKRQLKEVGATHVDIDIANVVLKDGSSTSLPEFYWLRDHGMIGWKPSSESIANEIDRRDQLVGAKSMVHDSLYQEYGLTPDEY